METKHTLIIRAYNKSSNLLVLIRPRQWIKNFFVFTPLLFSIEFRNQHQCLKALLAFLSFCVVSGATYIINDLCDRKEDRRHDLKKHRPIASGAFGTKDAAISSIILIAIGLLIGWYLNKYFALVILTYVLVGAVYSLWIKHLVILDVMAISLCFLLRIIGGCLAIHVTLSHWLALCTIMISLFLGFSKRRSELITITNGGKQTRKVLGKYSTAFLDQLISMLSGGTIICYTLYTVDSRTVNEFGSRALLLTIPSVIYGIFRYLYIVYHQGKGEDPSNTICRDSATIINLVIWLTISLLVITYNF